jgi:bacterial/archaeal transporter family protein
MPAWSLPALLGTVCLTGHYLTLRMATGKMGAVLGAFCVEAAAAAGILVLLLFRREAQPATVATGILWACGSGLFISGVTTLIFTSIRLGGPVMAIGPMVFGGGIALASLCGPLLFDEVVTVRRAIGVCLGLASLAIFATDRS